MNAAFLALDALASAAVEWTSSLVTVGRHECCDVGRVDVPRHSGGRDSHLDRWYLNSVLSAP